MSNKLGRPTESTKDFVIKARIDEDTKTKLELCVEVSQMSKSEVIRECINEMYYKLRSIEKWDLLVVKLYC